jgi:FSR family fosmidomycin resistance protein-like MFS transporter
LGRSFAFHTFTGHLGFAAAPPATAALMLFLGWRGAVFFIGLLGLPLVLTILWQSRILVDQARQPRRRAETPAAGTALLLSITVLHQAHGLAVATASSALTGYMVGMIGGVLVGGWVADRSEHHLPFVVILTIGAAALLLLIGVVSLAELPTIGLLFVAGLMTGASRTPRDVMVKDAAPPGEIGKVFGFVSSGMSPGGAIMPVPYGMIIDAGRPDLVLVVVAALLLLSLLCAGGARVRFRRIAVPLPAQ